MNSYKVFRSFDRTNAPFIIASASAALVSYGVSSSPLGFGTSMVDNGVVDSTENENNPRLDSSVSDKSCKNENLKCSITTTSSPIHATVWNNVPSALQRNDAHTINYWLPPTTCQCEKGTTSNPPSHLPSNINSTITTTPFKPLSRLNLLLYRTKLLSHSSLPTPRILTPNDPLFSYPQLQRGLRRRLNDETRLTKLLTSPQVKEARQHPQDSKKMNTILEEMNSLVYGAGVSPQMREDFLMQFGCTGYTPEILQYLVEELGNTNGTTTRGFVEVGSGNGQWARALMDYYKEMQQQQQQNNREGNVPHHPRNKQSSSSWEFVLAYDTMQDLPLSPQIYHRNTVPAEKYFYNNVRQCTSHVDAVQGYASRGRVLLLVYPPPGPMAVETAQAYVNATPKNDTIVYVGEGLGGANANNEFFEQFLGMESNKSKETSTDESSNMSVVNNQNNNAKKESSGKNQWAVLKVMDIHPSPGGKGYEKLFVLKKVG